MRKIFCGTDDAALHATDCPEYIAPAGPRCSCAEKCAEDAPNEWCDVCGVQGAEACLGEGTAVPYLADFPLYVGGVQVNSSNMDDITAAINESGGSLELGGIFGSCSGSLTLDDELKKWDRTGAEVDDHTMDPYLYIAAESKGAAEATKLTIGGETLTDAQLCVLSKDADGEDTADGYAAFDPRTNTLTLDNYTLNFKGDVENDKAISYEGTDTLNIRLIGVNTVTNTNEKGKGTGNGIYARGSLTISGDGLLQATGGYYGVCADGSITISGGSVGAMAFDYGYGMYAGAGITINGGTTVAQGETVAFDATPTIDAAFTGATVWYGDDESAANKEKGTPAGEIESKVYTTNKYVRISAPAASVTMNGKTTDYATLGEAVAAVSAADEADAAVMKLLDDIELSDTQYITSGVFTLDLNGFKLSSTVTALLVRNQAVVFITDSSASQTGTIIGVAAGVEVDGGTVTIRGGTIRGEKLATPVNYLAVTVKGEGTLNIEGGSIVCDNQGVVTHSGTVTITGGKIAGEKCDINVMSEEAVITLTLAEGAKTGAVFPGGISIGGTTLQEALTDGAAYWQGGKQITLTEDQKEITGGDVVIRAACDHKGNTNMDDGDCTTEVVCSECGIVLTPAKGHTEETIPGKPATCTETGLTDGVKCSVCETVLVEQTVIPANGHKDENGDGKCDVCEIDMTPVDPDVPVDPDKPVDPDVPVNPDVPSKPSSGGGNASASETVKNEDGSTTTITESSDGTVTEMTKYPDGSSTKVESKVDGSTTITEKHTNGVTVKTETTASDETTAQIKLPVKVDKATVTIPVKRPAPNIVVVIVNKDGTEKLVRDCIVTEQGVVFTVEEDAKVKVVQNDEHFADVHGVNHWAEEYVDFVAARDIFVGTAEKTFSPDAVMSRAMMAQALHSMEDKPESDHEHGFHDVEDHHWHSDGVTWTAEHEIFAGYDHGGFAPDETLTREQLAVVLYAFAEHKGCDVSARADLSGYGDVDGISAWALEAMQWAVAEGIMTGVPGGNILASGGATRAQVSVMLQRFCENVLN